MAKFKMADNKQSAHNYRNFVFDQSPDLFTFWGLTQSERVDLHYFRLRHVTYLRNFRILHVWTGSITNLRVLIGLAPKGKQMRWLIKTKIRPCWWRIDDLWASTHFYLLFQWYGIKTWFEFASLQIASLQESI
jgi:hypothetical protein